MSRKLTRKDKTLKALFLIIISIGILMISVSAIYIWFWHQDNKKIAKIETSISKINPTKEVEDSEQTEVVNPPVSQESDYWYYIKQNLLQANFQELLQKNSDTVGWIQVLGANINYPVVQTTNNEFYLNHDYQKNYNKAGWVYMDYRNNPENFNQNTIIYAHSRYDTTMFGSLKQVLTKKWLNNKDNYLIRFSTPNENTLWQVFSVYTIAKESYYITPTISLQEYMTFLTTLKERSIYNFNAELNITDKIITLSTCKDTNGNRVVLHAKLIKKETRV